MKMLSHYLISQANCELLIIATHFSEMKLESAPLPTNITEAEDRLISSQLIIKQATRYT